MYDTMRPDSRAKLEAVYDALCTCYRDGRLDGMDKGVTARQVADETGRESTRPVTRRLRMLSDAGRVRYQPGIDPEKGHPTVVYVPAKHVSESEFPEEGAAPR